MARKPKTGIETSAIETVRKMGVMLTPDDIARSGTEHAHQAAFFQWIATQGAKTYGNELRMMFAIPNGGARQLSVAAAMKAEGVKSGVPDMFLPVPFGYGDDLFHGLWIELKVPGRETHRNGGRDDKQVVWAKNLREQGYAVVTAYGWKACTIAIARYYAGTLQMPDDGDALPITEADWQT